MIGSREVALSKRGKESKDGKKGKGRRKRDERGRQLCRAHVSSPHKEWKHYVWPTWAHNK